MASVLFWIDIVLYKGLYIQYKGDELCQEYIMKDERMKICSGPSLAGTHPINGGAGFHSH